jgi:hypothetical protein
MAEDLDKLLETGTQPDTVASTSKRYPALRIISTIYRYLAYVSVVVGVIGVLVGISQLSEGREVGGIILLPSFLFGAIAFVTFLAIAEAIHVFIDIEENTRQSSSVLRKLQSRS